MDKIKIIGVRSERMKLEGSPILSIIGTAPFRENLTDN